MSARTELQEILSSLHTDCSVNCPHTVEEDSPWLTEALMVWHRRQIDKANREGQEAENWFRAYFE